MNRQEPATYLTDAYSTAGEGEISVVNLKCDTGLIGFFREEPGIFPG